MSDGQIVIDTRLNTEGVTSGLKRLKEETSNLGNSFINTSNKMGSFSDNLGHISKATNGMYNLLKPYQMHLNIFGITIFTGFQIKFYIGCLS